MSPARRARLARLTPRIIKPVWPDPEKHRRGLLHHVEFGLVLRETLPRLGVDPSQVKTLRVCYKAAEELRKLGHEVPDRPAPDCWLLWFLGFVSAPPPPPEGEPPAPPLPDDDPRLELLAKLGRMVDRYLADPEIDFGDASLMQVLTWCAARLAERWLPTEYEPEEVLAAEGEFAAD